MKPRDYCCCAIPIVNAGIYVTLVEQFTAGLVIGILSLATPSSKHYKVSDCFAHPFSFISVVGAATPSFAPWILAIVCFVGAAIQVLGFIGVAKVAFSYTVVMSWLSYFR
jgi:hypothetical protein